MLHLLVWPLLPKSRGRLDPTDKDEKAMEPEEIDSNWGGNGEGPEKAMLNDILLLSFVVVSVVCVCLQVFVPRLVPNKC